VAQYPYDIWGKIGNPGATVTVTNTETSESDTFVSNEVGEYSIDISTYNPNFPTGYTDEDVISVSAPDHTTNTGIVDTDGAGTEINLGYIIDKTFVLDTILKHIKNYTLDVYIKKLNTDKTYVLDTILYDNNTDKTYVLDTILKHVKNYTLDVIIQKPFYKVIYVNGTTHEDMTAYLIDFTLEQELGQMLDVLDIKVSRSIDDETWFDGFNPDVEIILRYSNKEIFRGRVKNRNIKSTYEVEIFSCAEITSRKIANKVYNNTSPEAIFDDLISTYTDLNPISTFSGTTIDRFVATEYIDSLIKKLAEALDYQIRSDGNKNIYFEPTGEA